MFDGFNENMCFMVLLLKLVCYMNFFVIFVKFLCVVIYESRVVICFGYVIFRRVFCIIVVRLLGKKELMYYNIDILFYWGCEMCIVLCF